MAIAHYTFAVASMGEAETAPILKCILHPYDTNPPDYEIQEQCVPRDTLCCHSFALIFRCLVCGLQISVWS